MRERSSTRLVGRLIGHSAMGAGLGLLLSLTLIVSGAGNVFEMIINSEEPKLTVAIFVGFFASIIAVGATLTGLILMAIEDS